MVRPLPILALLATILDCRGEPPAQNKALEEEFLAAQIKAAEVEARSLHSAITLYLVQSAACPASVEDLVSSRILAKLPIDPWGHPFVVECRDNGASVIALSLGPDGERGSADDILVETHEF